MATLSEALSLVHQFYQSGRLTQAEDVCRQILQVAPGTFEAWWYLGSICQGTGKLEQAVHGFQEALRINPNVPEVYNNLGNTLRSLGRLEEAVGNYRYALALKPDHALSLYNLGNVLRDQGKLDEAAATYRRATEAQPSYAEAYHAMGGLLLAQGRSEEAVANFQQALKLQPNFADAHYGLGVALAAVRKLPEAVASYQQAIRLQPNLVDAHRGMGMALVSMGKPAEAALAYQNAIRLQPGMVEGHYGLGEALALQGKLENAVGSYQHALRLQPKHAQALSGLGAVLAALGKLDDGVACIREALRQQPGLSKAHFALGSTVAAQGKLDEAEASLQEALRLQPQFTDARMNLGMVRLLKGDLAAAWKDYESRNQRMGAGLPAFDKPAWEGEDLAGKTILLYSEQGFGDTLHFVRYAPMVKERGGRVVVVCQPPLMRLLARCPGVDQVVARNAPLPPYDVHAVMLNLPGVFQTSLETIPATVPYLFSDKALITQWRDELRPMSEFKVGLVWQGSPGHKGDRLRSFPLTCFAPLNRVEGIRLFSLQKGHGVEQLQTMNGRLKVADLGSRISAEFDETAAVITQLDLVICADTSVAHLAGGLGKPVWVVVPYAPDWRWIVKREDSPWYPTMRLFRQKKIGEWGEVFERIAAALKESAADRDQEQLPSGSGEGATAP